MNLKNQPLLVFRGTAHQPLHGVYADTATTRQSGALALAAALEHTVIVTFEDATRHIFVSGGTGMRKTTSAHAPAVLRLIETGCAGLVVDIKGEYRHLVELHPDRVVAVGADDAATPINLLAGMSDSQLRAFLEQIRPATRETYWGSLGVQDALFVRRSYQTMGQEPTLAQIAEALAKPASFVAMFDAFIRWARELPQDYAALLEAVLANTFSILSAGGSRLAGGEERMTERDVQRQYTWQTAGLISALAPFAADPALRAKLSAEGSSILSLQDLLYRERKVLLLDLPVDRFGQAAHIASKLLRIRLIAAITGFRGHAALGCGEEFFTFFAADEYQHLVHLDQDSVSAGLYDDTTFFDRCRAYGHINLVTTQSVSALRARLPKRERTETLDCLLQNIGTVIAFSSADPATDALVQGRVPEADVRHISSVIRSDLAAGEAFVLGRALARHGGRHVVAQVAATHIAGAPHMSRYFNGMPPARAAACYTAADPRCANPYRDPKASSPLDGVEALVQSWQTYMPELRLALEALPFGCAEEEVAVFPMAENRSLALTLHARADHAFGGLDRARSDLVLDVMATPAWRLELPFDTALSLALQTAETLPPGLPLLTFNRRTEIAQTDTIRIWLLSREERSVKGESLVQIRTPCAALSLPVEEWRAIVDAVIGADLMATPARSSLDEDAPLVEDRS